MIPLIPIAISLLKEFGPDLVGLIAGDKAGDVAQKVVSIADDVTGGQCVDVAKELRENPELAFQFQTKLLENRGKLAALAIEDKKLDVEVERIDASKVIGAQQMQVAALGQDDKFSKQFIYYFAAGWSLFAMIFICWASFGKVSNIRVVDTVLGFLLGTAISGIFQFFFGSTVKSQRKDETIHSLANGK